MNNFTKINENICRLTVPFEGIYTTIYTVKTEEGVLLFDTASYDEDFENYIMPFLDETGITCGELKYVFISHNHSDHSGGLESFMKKFPQTCIVSRSTELKDEYKDYSFIVPEENDEISGVLKVVTIPGHTLDSSAVFDTRTKTLITGDCLQLYGVFGSGKWGANISFPAEYINAVDKLRSMDIQCILTAHDYHPCGYSFTGKDEITKALDCCIAPLLKIKNLIIKNPDLDDTQICVLYNSSENLPALGVHVVSAIRKI